MKHAIIIGASKCGTTSLYHMLGQHSQICLSVDKEPDYFGSNSLGFKDYASIWPNYKDDQHTWALEASTNYTEHPVLYKEIPLRIKDYGLNPKFIYLMRDPWDRIESIMRFIPKSSTTPYLNVHPGFIETCDYHSRLSAYADEFGKDSILPIQFEDFVDRPCAIADQVFKFLDLPAAPTTPKWALKTKLQFTQDYLDSSYRKTRKQLVMQKLQSKMKLLADHWDVDIQRWGFVR